MLVIVVFSTGLSAFSGFWNNNIFREYFRMFHLFVVYHISEKIVYVFCVGSLQQFKMQFCMASYGILFTFELIFGEI